MAEKIIAGTLKINTGTAVADVGNVNKELKGTSAALGNANEESKQTTSSFTNLKGALEKVPGPMGEVNKGITTVNASLKTLAANPIVLVITLLVAALVALYKAFASTQEGADKIEQIMSGLSAVVEVIIDRILKLAGAIVKVFSGDFKGAAADAKAAFSGVGDEIVRTYTAAAELTKRMQDLDDSIRDLSVSRAKLNRDLAATKELLTDENATLAEKRKAIQEVREAESAQFNEELKTAKERLDIAQARIKNAKSVTDELLDEEKEAKIALYALEQESSNNIRALNKQSRSIEKQARAEDDADKKEKHDAEMQRLADEKKAWEDGFNSRLNAQKINQQFIDEGISLRKQQAEDQKEQDDQDQKDRDEYLKHQTDTEWNAIQKSIKAKNDQYEKEKFINKLRVLAEKQYFDAIQGVFNNLSELFGKHTAAGKAMAIASATIDTFKSAEAAFSGTVSALGGGPWAIAAGVIAAAASVAIGIKNIQAIASVKVPGHGDGGGANIPSASAPTAPVAPQLPPQQSTKIDQDSIAGIGDATSGRAWVLSQDVTHDQSREERLNRAARLGG